MKPPGNAQQLLKGSLALSISSTLGSASLVITTQSAVTAGLGYLYVYAIFYKFNKPIFTENKEFLVI
jgi:hypothetical protein